MLREIVLDTETTGTDPGSGDRVVEIGCVELLNHIPTGRTYHVYVNPQRSMSAGALAVHGLSDALRWSLLPHGIGVSMVCPGLVKSKIYESDLIRPAELYSLGPG